MNEISRIRFRHLETFMEVARHNSVTRAAESLNLTQPSVTRTIRELEAVCGKALVAKDGRGIRITPHGEVFLRHAGRSLAAARRGLAALDQLTELDGPLVRVGALPTVSVSIMPDAVAEYLESGTRNRLSIVTGENRVLLNQLRNGELDMVIGRLPSPETMQGLLFEPLYREQVVFVVQADHPLAGQNRITAQDLLAYPVMVPTGASIIRPFVERMFIEQGLPFPERAIETVSDSFGRAFLRRQKAIWVISHGVVASEVASGEFTVLAIDTTSTIGSVGLNMRADTQLSPGAEVFASIVRRIAMRQQA